jgi:hemerythrin-like domain-containing protein
MNPTSGLKIMGCQSRGAATVPAPAGPSTAALRHEHEVILRALAVLEQVGRAVEAGAPMDPAARGWLVEFFTTFTDRCHHAKEEQHLFPALERRGVPRAGGPVGVMLAEHEEGRALVRRIAASEGAEAATAIRAFVALLRAHIDKENGVLFPLADQVLDEAEQHRLARAFDAVEQEAVGIGVHERLLAELGHLEARVAGMRVAIGKTS